MSTTVLPGDLRLLLLHQWGVDISWWCLKAWQVASGGGTPRELQDMAEYLAKRALLRVLELAGLYAAERYENEALYTVLIHAMSRQWLEGFYFGRLWTTRVMACLFRGTGLPLIKDAFIPDDHAPMAMMYLASHLPPLADGVRYFTVVPEVGGDDASTDPPQSSMEDPIATAGAAAPLFASGSGGGGDGGADAAASISSLLQSSMAVGGGGGAGTDDSGDVPFDFDTAFSPALGDVATADDAGYSVLDARNVGSLLDDTGRGCGDGVYLSHGDVRVVAAATLQRHLLSAVVDVIHTGFLAHYVVRGVNWMYMAVPKKVSEFFGGGNARFTGVPAPPPSARKTAWRVKAACFDLLGNAFIRSAGAALGYTSSYAVARFAYRWIGWAPDADPRRWAHYGAYWGGCAAYFAWLYAGDRVGVMRKTLRLEPWDGWFRVRWEDSFEPLSDDEEENDQESYERFNAVHKDDEETLYDKLGVEREVDPEELKRAYRKLAMKYHPDRHNRNEEDARVAGERMKEVTAAYHNLKDERRRRIYDAHLDAKAAAPPPPQRPADDTTAAAAAEASSTTEGGGDASPAGDAAEGGAGAANDGPPPEPSPAQEAAAFVAFHSSKTLAITLVCWNPHSNPRHIG